MTDWIDEDGYPTDEACEGVRSWPMEQGWHNMLLFVQSLWRYPDWITFEEKITWYGIPIYAWDISTGGWSGNESLISAMEGNSLFMAACWESSRRGGHYEFEVRITKDPDD